MLQKVQNINNDEFYTRYEDIQKELSMYKNIWKDKVVFCSCDDAVDNNEKNTSAFPLYFLLNFKELELKKLICTHYGGPVDLFNQGAKGYVFTKDGFSEIGKKEYPKGYTGSFDHPFSLKIESGKKFIIISNETNPINTAFIPYFKDSKVWSMYNSVYEYLNPKREIARAAGRWYTNLPVKDRLKSDNLKIIQLKDIPEKYKKYDDRKILPID